MPSTSIAPAIKNALSEHAKQDLVHGIKHKFDSDQERVVHTSFDIANIHFDFSKTHIDDALLNTYTDYAAQIDFKAKRHALFAGERVNVTEDRSVLHTLLRDPRNQGIAMALPETLSQAQSARDALIKQYHDIQADLARRSTPIRNIIHVGIGGSALGPQLIYEALSGVNPKVKIHFISNIDAHQLVDALDVCDADSTLVIGVSKTFTTAETLQNIDSVADWFRAQGVDEPLTHFYAVTAFPENAVNYGIPNTNIVSFPEWVGGRYSVWSSVSLSAALVFGIEDFEQFLAGAAEMDRHFYHAEPAENVCFIAAALDHYYANFMQATSRAIFAYDHRLRSLVDYLQQLETESNGKDRQLDGSPVDQETSAVIWGGVGTDVQHSVFQMLHQGTALIPSEFILVAKADHDLNAHHQELLANGVAQTAALLAGQDIAKVNELHAEEHLTELTKQAKIFSGERPSTTMLLSQLTPATLGSLLAFYEHRTFSGGVLVNINSYDQMGVELGKRLAKQVNPMLDAMTPDSEVQKNAEGFDASTLDLIARIRRA
ncbi:glucose-6-phosphate isomerase [Arenicella chitinivorans]|uniref:Glucose-6-phosphate isomerase n=1 Tax=Arenicella chitinivorans TaxID=1329800 RepID=A0A918VM47_9GAMM|nr:glucose-6-phosphate isomerase [Arenicella chitinivorans]GHA12395.1 glucose-6-phosphate isomerase [Arenicella chitinivorans]